MGSASIYELRMTARGVLAHCQCRVRPMNNARRRYFCPTSTLTTKLVDN